MDTKAAHAPSQAFQIVVSPCVIDLAPVVGIHMPPLAVNLDFELDLPFAEKCEIEVTPGGRTLRRGVKAARAQRRIDPPLPCAVEGISGVFPNARLGGFVRQYREVTDPALPCERAIPENMHNSLGPADGDVEAPLITQEERARILAKPWPGDRGKQDDIAHSVVKEMRTALMGGSFAPGAGHCFSFRTSVTWRIDDWRTYR